jgi:glucokinase
MKRHFLGIEIGGTKLQIVVGDDDARIVDRARFIVDKASGADGIRQQIGAALPALVARWRPLAIGVGFGGPVNWRTGHIARSHQVEGWSDFNLGNWLSAMTRVPVLAENDSNTAALAEATLGAGAGSNPVFYFNLGSGVGGGLVIDGRIYHGLPPGEAEFGHLRLDRDGTIVESRCSGWAVDRRIRASAASSPGSELARRIGLEAGGEAKHLAAALEAKDALATRILSELAEDLGFALSHAVHLLHPQVIILGGGLALVGEPLRSAVATALSKHLMEVFAPGPHLRLARLAEDAVPIGALVLARGAAEGSITPS